MKDRRHPVSWIGATFDEGGGSESASREMLWPGSVESGRAGSGHDKSVPPDPKTGRHNRSWSRSGSHHRSGIRSRCSPSCYTRVAVVSRRETRSCGCPCCSTHLEGLLGEALQW